jgi:hypothetical protein
VVSQQFAVAELLRHESREIAGPLTVQAELAATGMPN